MKKFLKRIGYFGAVFSALLGLFYVATWQGWSDKKNVSLGVTFSTVMARQLDIDSRKTYNSIIDDLAVPSIRLPIFWQDIEPERGKFVFSEFDYFLQKAEAKGVKLVLVVGRKLPRWPECHIPEWARTLTKDDFESAVKNQMKIIVERYRKSSAVAMWQIENEPFHTFGTQCAEGKIDGKIVEEEIALVRSLDSRPIMLTDSGEQGIWYSALEHADILGITIYRQVWNDVLGVVRFPFGPGFYALKSFLFSALDPGKKIIVSELQAEPWGPGKLLPDYSVDLQKKLMDEKRFRSNIHFARRTGFDTFYLWGTEWWFWLKEKQNDPSLWEEAKRLWK